ncbi:uncharacterized protein LOC142001759 [Carettochelys insculpta]|uniref:uncharacterized protein LOC142001759 n=1 Tax=Carettochelys insculpta TaxID=44489 RepID=UPI003EBA666A
MGDHMEEILGELTDLSLGGTPPSQGRRSPPNVNPRGLEMGGSSDWALSDLSESSSCLDASVDEEKWIPGSRTTGEPGRQSSGTRDAAGTSANQWLVGRVSMLQLVRKLFGLRQSVQEGPEPRNAQERGDFMDLEENSFLVPDVADSQNSQTAGKELTGDQPADKPQGDTTGNRMEETLGELSDLSLGGIPSSQGRRSPPTQDPSGLEMGDSGGFVNTAVGKDKKTAQDPANRLSGRQTERLGEAYGDTGTWGKAGISQVLHADDERLTPTAGPPAVTLEKCHAKEERKHLLKDDLSGGSPKAAWSPWNKFINMYKQRRKLPLPKLHLQENPEQLGMEEGPPTLNITVYEFATPAPHLISSKSSTTALICRLPDDKAGETVGHFGRAQVDLRANGQGTPEED